MRKMTGASCLDSAFSPSLVRLRWRLRPVGQGSKKSSLPPFGLVSRGMG